MGRASGLEQAFADVENAADAALKSASALTKLAKDLQKAAKQGNIAAIKREQGRLGGALDDLSNGVSAAIASWPFGDAEEEACLRDGYAEELREAASERGLTMYERDGRLFASPSIVRILHGDRAVRIDQKQVSAIRPSHLAQLLAENQKKPGRYPVAQFLEALHTVYLDIVRDDESASRLMQGKQGRVVPLARIYRLFTSRPGQQREYTNVDFARDLYLLDTSGVTTTRSGAVVSFHASSGTRSHKAGDIFTFVGPDGRDAQYYAVRFTEAN